MQGLYNMLLPPGKLHRPRPTDTPARAIRPVTVHVRPAKRRPPCATAKVEEGGGRGAGLEEAELRLELPTREVQAGLRFASIPKGRGVAVVVAEVAAPLAELGIGPGQQLLAISDPVRPADVWPVRERASLRNIRELIRMRRSPTIDLVLSPRPVPEWEAVVGSSVAATASTASLDIAELDDAAASGASMDVEGSLLDALEASVQPAQGEAAGTLAGRMGEAAAREQRAVSALQRRVKRRKDYLEQVSQRNDSGFFLGLFAAFVLPAAIGLALAYGTGYLDQLALGRFY